MVQKILNTLSLKVKRKVIISNIGQKTIITLKGTLREKPDKDDAWFYILSKKFDKFYDIGANIGLTALIHRLNNPNGRVLLVDPNPEALSDASHNLLLNNFAMNIDFYVSFVSDISGLKEIFYTVGSGAAGSMYKSHAKTAAKLNSSFEVDTISLDDLAVKVGWLPQFIKIDVEGAESKVLNGAFNLIKQCHPVIFVEMHALEEIPMLENAKKVLNWCTKVGYEAYYMASEEKITDVNIIAHRGKCHLLLIPHGMPYPVELRGIKEGSAIV